MNTLTATRRGKVALAILVLAIAVGANILLRDFTWYDLPAAQGQQKEIIYEDDPRWNCFTMGNLICGPDFTPVTSHEGLADALAEGEGGPDRAWEDCMVRIADTSSVVCPDGYVEVS